MCKFNQNLFIVTILWYSSWLLVIASPIDYLFLDESPDEEITNGGDYDMTFDQRQNGTENIRLRIDGVVIAVPSSASSQAGSTASNLAANYLLQLAAAADDDEDDDDKYFNFKNANTDVGVSAAPAIEKSAAEAIRYQEQIKKKVVAVKQQPEPIKENSIRRVAVKENVEDVDADVALQRTNPVVEENSKIAVIPVKKIQSRRKNKHKLRLGGLLNFLQQYKDQY